MVLGGFLDIGMAIIILIELKVILTALW